MRRTLALAAVLLAACAAGLPELTPERAEAFGAATCRATWSELNAAAKGIQLEGTASLFGREETFSFLLAGDGRYRREVSGPLGQLEVFDGQRVVRRDGAGLTRELDLGDRAEAPTLAAILTGAWIQDAGFETRVVHRDELRLRRPNTTLEFQLELDSVTGLPATLVEDTSSGATVMDLLEWQTTGGVPLPWHLAMRQAESGGEAETHYRVTRASVVDLESDSFFVSSGLPLDFTIDASVPGNLEALRAATGHLFVHPRIEGRDVGWFLLDTGAGAMVLSTDAAAELGLEELGEVRAVGVAGSAVTRYLSAGELQLGPLLWSDPIFVELDLGFVSEALGLRVAGIVGYDLFSRAVFEIDAGAVAPLPGGPEAPPAGSYTGITLHDTALFQPDPDWPAVDLAFQGRAPFARASFPTQQGPRTDWFRLDTGANGAVTFHSPAVARYDLLANRETTVANFGGVGGAGFGYFGELEWFELGGRRLGPLQAGFAMGATGTFSEGYAAGNLGQDVFRGARLVFDYSRERLYFAPSLASDEIPAAPDGSSDL